MLDRRAQPSLRREAGLDATERVPGEASWRDSVLALSLRRRSGGAQGPGQGFISFRMAATGEGRLLLLSIDKKWKSSNTTGTCWRIAPAHERGCDRPVR